MAGGVTQVQGVVAADPSIAAITGTSSTGIPVLLAQSWVAVSAPADTTEDVLASIAIPAGTLASNGSLRITSYWSFTNGVANKILRIRLGGASGTVYLQTTQTTATPIGVVTYIGAVNAQNSQKGVSIGTSNAPGAIAGSNTSAVDLTAATTVILSGQKGTSTDTLTLEGYLLEYIKASNS